MCKKIILIFCVSLLSFLGKAQVQCIPNFSYTLGTNGSVSFTNTSSPIANMTQWDFGDGYFALAANTSHTYNSNGVYTVCMYNIDTLTGNMCDTCINITISNANGSGPQPCIANFTTYVNGLNVFFNAVATNGGTIIAADWVFGDGNFGSNPSDFNAYAMPGTYNVCLDLYVQDSSGNISNCTFCDTVIVDTISNVNLCLAQANYTSTSSVNTVTFNNTSTCMGNATYTWMFGDGSSSNAVSPTHTYTNIGNYTVCLYMSCIDSSGITCLDTICNVVNVNGVFNCTTTASFTPSVSSLTASFTNNSSCGGTATYSWNFGDGSPLSPAVNPIHTYSNAGVYNVCLITTCFVQGVTCSDSTCMTIAVGNSTGCNTTANFVSTTSGLNVAFSNTSFCSGTFSNYNWTFGDGGSSNAASPTYTYANAGNYWVCLTVVCIDSNGTTCIDSMCQMVNVAGGTGCNTTANFVTTASGLNATFSNTSNCSGTATYSWVFGDGNFSNLASPNHTYATSGVYYVTLFVTCISQGVTCIDSISQWVQVGNSIGCNANANFMYTATGLTANFTNTSTCSGTFTNYNWTFGDGGSSNATSPTHTYASNGTYNVCLTVVCVDSNGTTCIDSLCYAIIVNNNLPCNVTANFTTSTNGLVVLFNNTTSCGGTSAYTWTFGDGSASVNTTNPIHTYTAAGTYTVCLAAVCNMQGLTCIDSFCTTINVIGTSSTNNINTSTQKLTIYPNPTNSEMNITLPSLNNQEITIYDVSAKVIRKENTGKLLNKKYTTPVSTLAKGMYFVVVKDGDIHYRSSFIKQ